VGVFGVWKSGGERSFVIQSKYDSGLLNKREVIVLTKTDLLEEKALKERIQVLSKKFGDVIAVSILDDASIKGFKEYLTRLFEGLMEASNES